MTIFFLVGFSGKNSTGDAGDYEGEDYRGGFNISDVRDVKLEVDADTNGAIGGGVINSTLIVGKTLEKENLDFKVTGNLENVTMDVDDDTNGVFDGDIIGGTFNIG